MPGHAGAHDAVARGGRTSARVAGHHARHTLHVLEHGVHSPKASAREHGDLLTLGRRDPGPGREGRDLRLRDADTDPGPRDRKSTRLNSSHSQITDAVLCLVKINRT